MALIHRLISLLPTRVVSAAAGLHRRLPILRRMHERIADRYRGADAVIERGAGRGLRFNAGNTYAGYVIGSWEPEMQRAFETFVKPGDVVYDGGANVGFWTVIAARLVGPAGRVISFEPLAANVERIAHNVQLNAFTNVDVRAVALGAKDGIANFLVSEDAGWGHLGEKGSVLAEKIADIDVPVRSIDSLVASGAIPAPSLIKLDIQGTEADVLRGATETLRRARPVLLVELHDTWEAVRPILADLAYATTVHGDLCVATPVT